MATRSVWCCRAARIATMSASHRRVCSSDSPIEGVEDRVVVGEFVAGEIAVGETGWVKSARWADG